MQYNDKIKIEESVVLAQNGQEEGFSYLWEYFAPRIRSYIFSRINNSSDVDDLLSEVFIRLFSKIHTFNSTKASFSTWIFTITKNILIDYYGSSHQKVQWIDAEKLVEMEKMGKVNQIYSLYQQTIEELEEKSLSQEVMLEKIRQVLDQLPPQYAELIRLKYFLGMDASEIALKKSKTQGNIRVALHRALLKAEDLIRKLNL